MNPRLTRWLGFLGGVILLVIGCLPFALLPAFDDPSTYRTFGFLFLTAGVAACWGFFPIPSNRPRQTILLIVAVSTMIRALLLPAPPSDDIHRYRWEGTIVMAGENPYRTTADDPSLAPYRDSEWEKMNHRDRGTVYPPVAQFLFAGMAIPTEMTSIPVEMAVFLIADLATLFLLFSLLRKRFLPLTFALFYALNPIVLLSFSGEAHYDAVLVFLLVAAVWALEFGWIRTSWVLLALSIQTKLISLALIPIWLLQRAYRGAWLVPVVILLTWIPFISEIDTWIHSVFEFGATTTFQGLIPFLLRTFSLPESLSTPIGAIVGIASLLYVFRKGGDAATLARRVLGVLILVNPILHFWYLSWLAPFLVLRPSLSWFWLCASQALYFLVWTEQAQSGYWRLPTWVEWFVWLPFIILGLCEWNRFRRHRPVRSVEKQPSDLHATVGVVIPSYQIADSLPDCIDSIQNNSIQPDQIVVVDGGSTDGTRDVAKERGVSCIESPLGRGPQIKAGIEALETDWVLILHADCLLHPKAIETIRQLAPEVAGGGCGQRFSPGTAVLTVVEYLNEGRAVVGESYWGDQGMFFRRSLHSVWDTLHQYPLMEDVEMSRLMRRAGETRYLGLETKAGTLKWKSGGRMDRFVLVFGTVIRFRLAGLFGRQASIAKDLYRRYYG